MLNRDQKLERQRFLLDDAGRFRIEYSEVAKSARRLSHAQLASIFDTHKFVKQMIATGFTEEQAETQVHLLSEILGYQLSTKADVAKVDVNVLEIKRDIKELDVKLETNVLEIKRDIKELDVKIESVKSELKRDIMEIDLKLATVEANLKRDIKELDVRMDTRFKELELRMVIKMGAMILAGIGLLFGLMRAWPLPVQYIPPSPQHAQEMRLPAPPSLPAK
ncbi:MAG: hypothetical protein HQL93_02615 [Magnetococcales bacterium]|nr:hypothetical protein [Magnetococcales bacterium]